MTDLWGLVQANAMFARLDRHGRPEFRLHDSVYRGEIGLPSGPCIILYANVGNVWNEQWVDARLAIVSISTTTHRLTMQFMAGSLVTLERLVGTQEEKDSIFMRLSGNPATLLCHDTSVISVSEDMRGRMLEA